MKRPILFILLICPIFVVAQKSPTYLSVEAGGNGIGGSVSVARPFIIHPDFNIIFQWGVGFSPESTQSKYPINLPAQLICKIGKKQFFLELGIGSSLILESTMDKAEDEKATSEWYLSPILGLRYEKRSWFGRFYTCPLFHVSGENVSDELTTDFVKIGAGLGIIF